MPPPEFAAPAGCHAAAPGGLCEGDGACGTREDLNNCYDASYTYPSSRDVPWQQFCPLPTQNEK